MRVRLMILYLSVNILSLSVNILSLSVMILFTSDDMMIIASIFIVLRNKGQIMKKSKQ